MMKEDAGLARVRKGAHRAYRFISASLSGLMCMDGSISAGSGDSKQVHELRDRKTRIANQRAEQASIQFTVIGNGQIGGILRLGQNHVTAPYRSNTHPAFSKAFLATRPLTTGSCGIAIF
jgi:hypothetical protein